MRKNDARQSLRNKMQNQRLSIPPTERLAAAQAVYQNLQELPEFLTDEHIAGYWAVRGEVPLHAVQSHINRHHQHYYLPLIDKNPQYPLRFGRWSVGEDLQPNDFGIPEPADPSIILNPLQLQLVLVPLFAFDQHGNRLGSGKGYYDRAFAPLQQGERPREPVLVGVAYAFQEVECIEEVHSQDIPLDFIVTDQALIDCTKKDLSK